MFAEGSALKGLDGTNTLTIPEFKKPEKRAPDPFVKMIFKLMRGASEAKIAPGDLEIIIKKVKKMDQFHINRENRVSANKSPINRIYFCALMATNNMLKRVLLKNQIRFASLIRLNFEIKDTSIPKSTPLFNLKLLTYFKELVSIEQNLQKGDKVSIQEEEWQGIKKFAKDNLRNKKVICLGSLQSHLNPYIELISTQKMPAGSTAKEVAVKQNRTLHISPKTILIQFLPTLVSYTIIALLVCIAWMMKFNKQES